MNQFRLQSFLALGLLCLIGSCSGSEMLNRKKNAVQSGSPVGVDSSADSSQTASVPQPVCGSNLSLAQGSQGRPSDCGEGLGNMYLSMVCPVVRSQTSVDGQDLCCGFYQNDGKKFTGDVKNPTFTVQYLDGTRANAAVSPAETTSKCNYTLQSLADRSVKDITGVTFYGSVSNTDTTLYAIPSLGDFLVKTTGPMNLYVRGDGKDIGVCEDPGKPCATIAKALSVIPSKLTFPVRIFIGGPSISGAATEIPNFFIEAVDNKSTGSLSLEGMSSDFKAEANVDLSFPAASSYGLRMTGSSGSGQMIIRNLTLKSQTPKGQATTSVGLYLGSFSQFVGNHINFDGWDLALLLDRLDASLSNIQVRNSTNGIAVQNHSSASLAENVSLEGCANLACAGTGLLAKASSVTISNSAKTQISNFRIGLKLQDSSTATQTGMLDVSRNLKVGLLARGSNFDASKGSYTRFTENNTSLGDITMELDKDGVGEIFLDNSRMNFDGTSAYSPSGTKIAGMVIKPAPVTPPSVYWSKSDVTLSSSTITAGACLECFGVLTNMTPGNGDFYIYAGWGSATMRHLKALRPLTEANTPIGSGKAISLTRIAPVGVNYYLLDSTGRWCHLGQPTEPSIPNAYLQNSSPGFTSLPDATSGIMPAQDDDLLLEFQGDCLFPAVNGLVLRW